MMLSDANQVTNAVADEPTSGLDSQTAWSICKLLRKLVDSGQTVLCTIHQPSAQIFSVFDRLLLLKNGAMVYFGEIGHDGSALIPYFEQRGTRMCLVGENPAEWLLEVTQNSAKDSDESFWAKEWMSSQERQAMMEQLVSLTESSVEPSDVPLSPLEGGEFAAPFAQQLLLLVVRLFRDQWRSPTYLYTKAATCTGLVSCLPRDKYRINTSLTDIPGSH
jgi:ATP-binding cassette, subfamily G (WHITE), member 2, PDR